MSTEPWYDICQKAIAASKLAAGIAGAEDNIGDSVEAVVRSAHELIALANDMIALADKM